MISYLIGILFFLILEGLFSGSELALFSVDRNRLKYLAKNGDKRAKKIYETLEKRFDEYVAVCLIGTTLSIVTITALFVGFLHSISPFVPFIKSKEELFAESIIILTLLFGEIIPKSVFQHYADRLIYFIVPFAEFSRKVLYPFLVIAKIINRAVFFIFRLEQKREKILTREELLDALILESEGIEEFEKKIVANVLIFEERRLGEIVVPLSDVAAVPTGSRIKDIIHIFKDTGFSRIPVYKKRIDQIIGVLRAYDLAAAAPEDPVDKFVRPIRYLPEFTSLPNVLKGFKQFKDHMAVVVDERGATMGIITLEDVLEEIVGEIRDEFSKKEKRMIKKYIQDKVVVDGRLELKEVEVLIGVKLPDGPYETVGGMIIYIKGRMPKRGETLTVNGVKFTVLSINIRRVQEVMIEKIKKEEEQES
ncbi:Hemolysin, contains CBS domains [Persephonella hydrogeniphila]|uniref:Hemolysin, contains CBS domains n=1 Tax=Persephonella hydrogeniphila TaxID=198703 RepID=A0A285N3M2_9AQUI|nr:hemolysin family protein [Persephonella hydrogeniphila]SNZ04030.1 Hemolysin, contains CBS domains [Persephonella hydrogeniphila]